MATNHQIRRLERLSSALRKILEFAQARNADGSFRQGSTVSADAFRKANRLTNFRGPAKARPTFGQQAAAVAPAARQPRKDLRQDVLNALNALKVRKTR